MRNPYGVFYKCLFFSLFSIFAVFVHHVQRVSSFTYAFQNNEQNLNFRKMISQFTGDNVSMRHMMFFFVHSHVFEPKKLNVQHAPGAKTQRIL